MTVRDRVIRTLAGGLVLNDDELARKIGADRHHINAVCRRLQGEGLPQRQAGSTGKTVNRLLSSLPEALDQARASSALHR